MSRAKSVKSFGGLLRARCTPVTYPPAVDAKGIIIYTPDGSMSAPLMRSGAAEKATDGGAERAHRPARPHLWS
jgi:Lipocalin-like domain